jgi:hypothetical protein
MIENEKAKSVINKLVEIVPREDLNYFFHCTAKTDNKEDIIDNLTQRYLNKDKYNEKKVNSLHSYFIQRHLEESQFTKNLFDYKAQLKRDLDNRRETKEVSKISLEFSKTKLEPDSMNLTYNETRAKEAQKSFEKVQKRYNSIVELYKEVEQSQELIEIFGNYEGTLWEQQKNNSELER